MQLVVSAVLLVMSLFYQQSPPTSPSKKSAIHTQIYTQAPFLKEVSSVFKNKMFWLLILIFSLPFALFVALWGTLEEVLKPAFPIRHLNTTLHFPGENPDVALNGGIIGLTMMGGGIVGSLLLGKLIDIFRTTRDGIFYKIALGGTTFLVLVSFLIWHLLIRYQLGLAALIVVGFVSGFASIALLPAALECGVEMTFPVSEATSGGILLMMANVFATIYILVITLVADSLNSVLALCCVSFISAFALFLFRPRYLRLEAERTHIIIDGQVSRSESESEDLIRKSRDNKRKKDYIN